VGRLTDRRLARPAAIRLSTAPRALGATAFANADAEKSAGAVFALNFDGERAGSLSEQLVRQRHLDQVTSSAGPVQLSHCRVKTRPQRLGSTATGTGLQLVRLLRVRSVRRPREAGRCSPATDRGLLTRHLGKLGEASTEPGIGWRQPVGTDRSVPTVSRRREHLLDAIVLGAHPRAS